MRAGGLRHQGRDGRSRRGRASQARAVQPAGEAGMEGEEQAGGEQQRQPFVVGGHRAPPEAERAQGCRRPRRGGAGGVAEGEEGAGGGVGRALAG